MFLFYAVHYPQPEKEELLIQSMQQFGELIKKQPGIIFVNPSPFRDTEKGAAHRPRHLGITGSFRGILARFGERCAF